MPLTKSEFDRLMAERSALQTEAGARTAAMKDRPKCAIARFSDDGKLDIVGCQSYPSETETRALYEMLRAWYGEATMTETAKAVIEAADARRDLLVFNPEYSCSPSDKRIIETVDAYRAEQKQ